MNPRKLWVWLSWYKLDLTNGILPVTCPSGGHEETSVLSAIVPSISSSSLHFWVSAGGGQVQGAGIDSWVELGYAANSTKVRLKSVLGTLESRQAYLLGRRALCCGGWDRGMQPLSSCGWVGRVVGGSP